MDLPIAGAPAAGPDAASAGEVPSGHEALTRLVHDNDLVLFMKGTPEAPMCGFSARAAGVLDSLERPYHAVNVFAHPDPMAYIHELAVWAGFPTLPQVWVKGELIGGSDIALEMLQSGELQTLLE